MKRILFIIQAIAIFSYSSAQVYDYQPLLQNGKVWNYELRYVDQDFNFLTGTSTDWIEGDTIVNGLHIFKMYSVASDKNGVFTSYWYEADKKVFVTSASGESLDLVYDFSLEPGDFIPIEGFLSGGFHDLFVREVDTVKVKSYLRERTWFTSSTGDWDFCWIEGVGGPWRLSEPTGHIVSDGRTYALLSCYVGAECIFERADFDAPATSGVSSVETLSRPEKLYDLTGRRLSSPPSQGIYIRNGKKYVVK